MTKRVVILAVGAALALAAQPALAKGSRGGGGRGGGGHASVGRSSGGHSGGGHSGGGYAVPRGSGSRYMPGNVAAARHPSGGSGYHGGHYYSSGHGSYGHGSYGHSYYGHSYYGHSRYGYGYGAYYPYYGYYGGYYGSGFGLSLGFGPYAYGSLYYGWPGSYGYPYGSTNVYVQPSDAGSDDPGYRRPDDARVQGDYVPNTGASGSKCGRRTRASTWTTSTGATRATPGSSPCARAATRSSWSVPGFRWPAARWT